MNSSAAAHEQLTESENLPRAKKISQPNKYELLKKSKFVVHFYTFAILMISDNTLIPVQISTLLISVTKPSKVQVYNLWCNIRLAVMHSNLMSSPNSWWQTFNLQLYVQKSTHVKNFTKIHP